ncbi:hypothetical protein ACHAXT_013013 [Thalassiosira profunda]
MLLSLLKSALVAAMPLAVQVKGDSGSLRPNPNYPNEPRKAALEDYFGQVLLAKGDYEDGYTQVVSAVYTTGIHNLDDEPPKAAYRNILVQADEGDTVANVKLTFEEAKLICASFCDADDECEAVDVTAFRITPGFSCSLLDSSQGPVSSLNEDCGCAEEVDFTGSQAVLYKSGVDPFEPNTCDLPISDDLEDAATCVGCCATVLQTPIDSLEPDDCAGDVFEICSPLVGDGVSCGDIVTDDFFLHVAPALLCIAAVPMDPAACLSCMQSALNEDRCLDNVSEVCSEDEDVNPIFKPCFYTESLGTAELPEICGARNQCGDFCPEACLDEIKSASLCALAANGQCITNTFDFDGREPYTCKEEEEA